MQNFEKENRREESDVLFHNFAVSLLRRKFDRRFVFNREWNVSEILGDDISWFTPTSKKKDVD